MAERFAAVEALWREQPGAIDPVVRGIVEEARRYSALDAFQAEYRRALARAIQQSLADGRAAGAHRAVHLHHRTAARGSAGAHSRLGRYTNFANLADLCALALPAGMRGDGLPAGITVLGLAWQDHALAEFGRRWQARLGLPLGATGKPLPAAPASRDPAPGMLRVAVVGAHLSGMPLNHQLRSRHAVLVEKTRTAGDYRLYALANTTPPAGPARADGAPIEVELWDIPLAAFGGFVAEIPPPLGIGTLELEDGRQVKGFICEPRGLEGASDITAHGGWRAYLASLNPAVR